MSGWFAGLSMHVMINLFMALLCGGLLGLERSVRGRQAGMRTYALVSLAAACVMSAIVQESAGGSIQDPSSRVIQGLLTGLGFLGGGVIMQEGINIKGLTTAASIWLTAGLGIICGLGLWGLGLMATVLALAVLSGLKHVESWMSKDHYAQIKIAVDPSSDWNEQVLKQLLIQEGLKPVEVGFSKKKLSQVEYHFTAIYTNVDGPNRLADRLIGLGEKIQEFSVSASPE